ncbi:MAG: hypothetical protein ABI777_11110, partial [Betaproteobacteria bacterium]
MIAVAGVLMLALVAVVLLLTGLPSWLVLTGVAMLFGALATAFGVVPGSLLTALPARLVGLLENDLLQALPLYVLLGALLNHLPLAGILFRPSAAFFAVGMLFTAVPIRVSLAGGAALLAAAICAA